MFSVRFLKVLKGSLGAHRVDLGAIRGAFWGDFGDFFLTMWIFENVCFIIVKLYFLRFGRVLVGDFFLFFLRVNTFSYFVIVFLGFVGPKALHRVPNGSLLGDFCDKNNAKLVTLVASWFQSGSQASKRSHFGSFWGVF